MSRSNVGIYDIHSWELQKAPTYLKLCKLCIRSLLKVIHSQVTKYKKKNLQSQRRGYMLLTSASKISFYFAVLWSSTVRRDVTNTSTQWHFILGSQASAAYPVPPLCFIDLTMWKFKLLTEYIANISHLSNNSVIL